MASAVLVVVVVLVVLVVLVAQVAASRSSRSAEAPQSRVSSRQSPIDRQSPVGPVACHREEYRSGWGLATADGRLVTGDWGPPRHAHRRANRAAMGIAESSRRPR